MEGGADTGCRKYVVVTCSSKVFKTEIRNGIRGKSKLRYISSLIFIQTIKNKQLY